MPNRVNGAPRTDVFLKRLLLQTPENSTAFLFRFAVSKSRSTKPGRIRLSKINFRTG